MRLNHPSGGWFGPPTSSTLNVALAVDEKSLSRPLSLAVLRNPMMRDTPAQIEFSVPQSGRGVLRLYDATGAVVTTLVDGEIGAGAHVVPWNGLTARGYRAHAGVYFLRLSANHTHARATLVVLH